MGFSHANSSDPVGSEAAGSSKCPLRAATARPGELAPPGTLWQGSPRLRALCSYSIRPSQSRCRSSVVEHSLGKGEVVSSILTGSTRNPYGNTGFYALFSDPHSATQNGTMHEHDPSSRAKSVQSVHLTFRAQSSRRHRERPDDLQEPEPTCTIRNAGRPVFIDLMFRRREPVYFVFDILIADGEDVRTLPPKERKASSAGMACRKPITWQQGDVLRGV